MSLLNALDQSESHENGGWAASHQMPLDDSQANFSPKPKVKKTRKKKVSDGEDVHDALDSSMLDGSPKKKAREPTPKQIEKQQIQRQKQLEREEINRQKQIAKEQKEIERKEKAEQKKREKEEQRVQKEMEKKQKLIQKQYEKEQKEYQRQLQQQHLPHPQSAQQQLVYYDQNYQGGDGEQYQMYEGEEYVNEEYVENEEEYEVEEEEYHDGEEYSVQCQPYGQLQGQVYMEGHNDGEEYEEGYEDEEEDEEEVYGEEDGVGEEELVYSNPLTQLQQQYATEEDEEEEDGGEEEEGLDEEELMDEDPYLESPVPHNIPLPQSSKTMYGPDVSKVVKLDQKAVQMMVDQTRMLAKRDVKDESIQYVLVRKKDGKETRTVLTQKEFQAIHGSGRKHKLTVDPKEGRNQAPEVSTVAKPVSGGGNMNTKQSATTTPTRTTSVSAPTIPTAVVASPPTAVATPTITRMVRPRPATPHVVPRSQLTTIVTARPLIRGAAIMTSPGGVIPIVSRGTPMAVTARTPIRAGNATGLHMITPPVTNNRTPTLIGNRVFQHVTTTSISQSTVSPFASPRQTLAGGSVVLCPNCGMKNKQYQRCDSCGKPIPATSRIVQSDPISPARFYGNDGSPVFNHRNAVNTYSNVRTKRRATTGGGTRKQARYSNAEPEVVTINSSEDEEEHSQPTSVTLNVSRDGSAENRVVVNSTPSSQSSRVAPTSQPSSSQSPGPPQAQSQQKTVSFEASTVYVGTMRGKPYKPLHLSREAVQIDMEADDTVELTVPMTMIKQCDICTDVETPSMHLLVTAEFAETVRNDYNVCDPQGHYFDPDSPMAKHKFVIIILQKQSADIFTRVLQVLNDVNISRACIDDSNRVTKFLNELSAAESVQRLRAALGDSDIVKKYAGAASEREKLAQDAPKRTKLGSMVAAGISSFVTPLKTTVTRLVSPLVAGVTHGVMGHAMAHETVLKMGPGSVVHVVRAPEEERVPTPPRPSYTGPVVKLFTYPPPPATGAITVSTEDLFCLTEGEFLNDVIIDFYLKYLVHTLLTEEQRERTHVFSSFFYRRLTQRPAKRSAEDINLSLAKKRHNRVKTWTRHVDLFSKDFIVVPINESAHWFLAIVCFPSLRAPQFKTVPFVLPPFRRTPETADNAQQKDKEECKPDQGNKDGEEEEETEEEEKKKKEVETEQETGEEESAGKEHVAMEVGESTEEETEVVPESQDTQMDSQETIASEQEESVTGEKVTGEKVTGEKVTGEEVTGEPGTEEPSTETNDESSEDSNESKPREDQDVPAKEGEKTAGRVIMRKITEKQPCILVMDSLTGSRSHTIRIIRDYLQVEWDVKKKEKEGSRSFTKDFVKGSTLKVPQQNNFSDCGLYVLQYVEQFFKAPIRDFTIPVQGLENWFPQEVCDGKRQQIRQLLFELQKKYNPSLQLQLNTS